MPRVEDGSEQVEQDRAFWYLSVKCAGVTRRRRGRHQGWSINSQSLPPLNDRATAASLSYSQPQVFVLSSPFHDQDMEGRRRRRRRLFNSP